MSVRVEFKDGTERLFKDCTGWSLLTESGIYQITSKTKLDLDEPTYKTKLFSREVEVEAPEQEYKTNIHAFIHADLVVLVEEIE